MSRTGRRGFTLVELIVVVAIIALLTAIAFPVTAHVVQYGRAAACVSNLDNIGVALHLYLGDHNEIMPTLAAGRTSISQNVPVIDNTLNAYVRDSRVFACPADNRGLAAATGTSYYWNSVLNGQSLTGLKFLLLTKGQNVEIPVLSDKEAFHPYESSKVNILYADGHASQDVNFTSSP